MIAFEKKKINPAMVADETENNRFDAIRKIAAQKHRKSNVDSARCRDDETQEENQQKRGD